MEEELLRITAFEKITEKDLYLLLLSTNDILLRRIPGIHSREVADMKSLVVEVKMRLISNWFIFNKLL